MRSVDFCRVQMYWHMGKRIKKYSQAVETGFSARQLERCRQFYRLYPIASTLRTQLNWNLSITVGLPEL